MYCSCQPAKFWFLSDRVCAVAFYHHPQLFLPKSRLSLLTIVDSGFRIMVYWVGSICHLHPASAFNILESL